MALIHQRPCPVCGSATHQRFMNCLREGACGPSHWLCLNCNSRLAETGELLSRGRERRRVVVAAAEPGRS
ncbi:MAG: hypothetical protein AB7D51_12185 [Desulfovibrionaceae bacterium]